MPPPEVAVAHYAAQARQAEAVSLLVKRQWRDLDTGFDGWPAASDRMTKIVAAGQLGAARAGDAYVAAALAEQGYKGMPLGAVNPAAFAGVASDGRPLDSLLYSGVTRTREALGRGESPADAMKAGGQWLETVTKTQVADAGRGAAGVAVAARPGVGYTRLVSPPCCQRCAILAGKFFKWNTGFQRHPRCDCRHVPANADDWHGLVSDVPLDQIQDLTKAQRQAVEDGADLNQIVNSRRGRSRNGMTTSEGTSRRGVAGRMGVQRRLTPEAIYRTSETREQALERLRANGYILDRPKPVKAQAPTRAPKVETLTSVSDDLLEERLAAAWEAGEQAEADRIMAEIDRRETAKAALPKTKAAQFTESSTARWVDEDFDDELIRLMQPDAAGWVDQQAIDQLEHLMDVREKARKADEAILAQLAREADERDAARRLLDQSARRKPKSVDEQLRSDYDDFIHVEWLKAEAECNGVLLNNAGRAAGISPQSLWSGRTDRARKYASEELKTYWQRNGRINYSTFRADALGRASDRGAREATTKEGWYDSAA